MYTLEEAQKYIKNNSSLVVPKYRNNYHLMAPIGWINDPNGFVFYKGEYHLFFQYYPYKPQWGPMHWGHAKSKDLVTWENLPVALAPDKSYDKDGCFSGTAMVKNDELILMYTGHIEGETPEDVRQVQCLATSTDGIHFTKSDMNPVINEQELPDNALPQDFRDPKVIKRGDYYYSLIASKNKREVGQILLYRSKDLMKWKFQSVLLEDNGNNDTMWECPDLFELDGKDVLIISVENLPEKEYSYSNTHSVLAFVGEMNWESGNFNIENSQELDNGLDFYAPQTLLDERNRRIMVSWMQMWGRNIPTEEHKWAGSMTLPRELKIKNQHVFQKPVKEIENYFVNKQDYTNISLVNNSKEIANILDDSCVVELDIDVSEATTFKLEIRKNVSEKTAISYDTSSNMLEFDRKNSGIQLIGKESTPLYKRSVKCLPKNNMIKLQMFFDKASIEIFINDGEHTITSTIYPTETANDMNIISEGKLQIPYINKWELNI